MASGVLHARLSLAEAGRRKKVAEVSKTWARMAGEMGMLER